MKKILILTFLFFVSVFVYSQNTISGTFRGLNNQQIKLVGFSGFDTYVIDNTQANEKGEFKLFYSKNDDGMGYLVAEGDKRFFVILSGEDIKLKGDSFAYAETIEILESEDNKLFEQYASEHPRREQALSAWIYLEKIYSLDSLFAVHDVPKQAILKEKQRIRAEDSLFLSNLEPQSFISWYLPVRKLVSAVSIIAQYRTEEIPASIATFRSIDYMDNRLYKSGLLGDVLESHFWLIENSGRTLDSVFIEMNISIDNMFETLTKDERRLNEITLFLFNLLERRSLYKSSEYLALKVLNEFGHILDDKLAKKMEAYRTMKIGNIAPDFIFYGDVLAPSYPDSNIPKKLSDIKSRYIVVVFAASWCNACPEEIFKISELYDKWKNNSVEVVFVSLDEDKQVFKNFAGIFPFISLCDYKKWESPVVESYHVFATPTIYLLDNNREILLHPKSVSQMDAWVDWFLVKGNR